MIEDLAFYTGLLNALCEFILAPPVSHIFGLVVVCLCGKIVMSFLPRS